MARKIIPCIVAFFCGVAGFVAGAVYIGKKMTKGCIRLEGSEQRFRDGFNMMLQWMNYRQNGRLLAEYLVKNGIQKIAIYGAGGLGEALYKELENSSVQIMYGIDKNADVTLGNLSVFMPSSNLERVDAVIVTPFYCYDDIYRSLHSQIPYRILSLEDVVYGMKSLV